MSTKLPKNRWPSYYNDVDIAFGEELYDFWESAVAPCDDSHEPERIPGQLRKIDGQGFHCVFFCGECMGRWKFPKGKSDWQHWVGKDWMVYYFDFYERELLEDYSLHESRKQLEAILPIYQCRKCDADRGDIDRTCVYESCQRTDTQEHHFAPRTTFDGECDHWPTGFLCPIHHREWHTRVTPYLKPYGAFRLVSPRLWKELMTLVPADQAEPIETQRSVEQDLQQKVKVTTLAIGDPGRFS